VSQNAGHPQKLYYLLRIQIQKSRLCNTISHFVNTIGREIARAKVEKMANKTLPPKQQIYLAEVGQQGSLSLFFILHFSFFI
jgi:hypothetical protein